MAHCVNCGTEISEGAKFCPSCGTAVKEGAPTEVKTSTQDAEDNKGMAIVAYLLFFIPLLTGDYKKSPFLRFHANQGTVLFISSVAAGIGISIIWAIIGSIIGAIFVSPISSAVTFYKIGLIGAVLTPLIWLAILILAILGIINAAKGNMKPLPIIGRFEIIK